MGIRHRDRRRSLHGVCSLQVRQTIIPSVTRKLHEQVIKLINFKRPKLIQRMTHNTSWIKNRVIGILTQVGAYEIDNCSIKS
jgi:hypothetical protein